MHIVRNYMKLFKLFLCITYAGLVSIMSVRSWPVQGAGNGTEIVSERAIRSENGLTTSRNEAKDFDSEKSGKAKALYATRAQCVSSSSRI